MKLALAIGTLIILVASVAGGCASSTPGFDSALGTIVKPYRFSIAGWELKVFMSQIKQIFSPRETADNNEVNIVLNYFSQAEQSRMLSSEIEAVSNGARHGDITALEAQAAAINSHSQAMQGTIAKIIAGQIKETLAEQGIYNPIDSIGLKITFPPVNFELGKPPRVLIISPRDRIENMKEINLVQELEPGQVEDIEVRVDALGVSSLVEEPGGFGGTYPTFVVNKAGLRYTINTAAHEWLHQYLAFKPLGFRYVLDLMGISKSYDIVTMNETVAGILGREIGDLVLKKYYPSTVPARRPEPQQGFDFNREMREIRREVDRLLAGGKIEAAEKFMEQKREYLASNGYYIRKLNQAYFAFHGSYADSPTSISPIGVELRKLRSQSASLKEFLSTVSAMTSRQDLVNAVR